MTSAQNDRQQEASSESAPRLTSTNNSFSDESIGKVGTPSPYRSERSSPSEGRIVSPRDDRLEEGFQKSPRRPNRQKNNTTDESIGKKASAASSDGSPEQTSQVDDFNSMSADFVNFKGGGINRSVSILSDEEELRNAVPWVLQLLGCHKRKVFQSTNGVVSATTAIELKASDLVFCDLGLGLSCLSALREVADGIPIPPVVLIVDRSFEKELLSQCLGTGADGYVMKPLRIQALRGLVTKYISDDATKREAEEADAVMEKDSDEGDKGSYEMTRCIGNGAAGEVWLVKRKRDGAKFALKEINIGKLSFPGQQRVLNEIRLHRSFSCPCIIRTFSSWLQENNAYLLMEYVRHGTLRDLVKEQKLSMMRIEDASTTEWGAQILLALLYLHNKGVLHRDLKLENILGPDNDKCVKLTDFGISKQMRQPAAKILEISPQNVELSMVGTAYIMAPERVISPSGGGVVFDGDGRESDLWSFGVVLYELITLKPPFGEIDLSSGSGDQRETLFEHIGSKSPEPLPYSCDAGLHKIVTGGLLQKNPKDRPTAADLVKDSTLGKAMLYFLKRMNLMNHPAVLEVVDVTTVSQNGTKTDRIECSNLDAVSLYAQRSNTSHTNSLPESSRLGRELLARAGSMSARSKSQEIGSPQLPTVNEDFTTKEDSKTLVENYSDQIMGIDKGLEEQLTQMTRSCDQLRADIEQHKVELRYLRRPVEAAQRQSDLIAAYVRHRHDGILHPWSLRFVKKSVELEYAFARRQRVALRIAAVAFIIVGASIGRLAVGDQPSWLGNFAGELDWHTQQLLVCGTLGSSVVAIACSLVMSRKVRQVLFVCELFATLLLNLAVLLLIVVHDPLYSLALSELIAFPIRSEMRSPCPHVFCSEARKADEELPVRLGATAFFAIGLSLSFVAMVVPVRYVVQLVIFFVLIPICVIVELAVESTLACRSSGDGGAPLRLTLLSAVVAAALVARRNSDSAERFQCLLTGRDSSGTKKEMMKNRQGSRGEMGLQSRKSFSRTFSSMSTQSGTGGDKRNWFATAAKSLSGSGVSLGEKKIERSATTNSEAIFQAFEEADDEVTRTISLVSIEERGFKERWLLDSECVRIAPTAQTLGKGGFGVVVEGELYGSPIALKLPKKSGDSQSGVDLNRNRNNIGNELRVLRHVWHPNIVVFYGCTIDLGSQEIMIILELLRGEPLDEFCCRRERPPSTAMRHKLALDICSALRSLHGLNPRVVHGDLKGSNILVELWDSGPRAKLLDFGLSRLLTTNVSPLGGTVRWMAPEVIRRRTDPQRAPAADIFSFGRLAFLIVTGRQPLRDYTAEQIVQAVQRSQVLPLDWPRMGPLVNECKPLADRCLYLKAYMRPEMETVLDLIKTWQVPPDTGRRVSIHGSIVSIAPRPQGTCVDWDEGIGVAIAQARSKERVTTSHGLKLGNSLWDLRRRLVGAHNDRDADFMNTLMKEVSSHGRLIEPSRIKLMPDQLANVDTNTNILMPGELDGYLTALRVPRTCLSGNTAESIGLDFIKLELQALLHVKHPNIVAFHGLCFAPEYCCVLPVVEWVEGVSLDNFSLPPPAHPDEGTRLRVLLDICSALLYLHCRDPPVVHGGLNCNNVLIEARLAGPRAKILDVGIARTLARYSKRLSWMPKSDEERKRRKRKHLYYTAPELLHRNTLQHFDPSADVFSLGRLCHLVVCGRQSFEGIETPELERAARRFEVVPLTWPAQPVPLQRKCRQIVERCLSLHKIARPGIRDVQKDMTHWHGDDDMRSSPLSPKGVEEIWPMEAEKNGDFAQDGEDAQANSTRRNGDLMPQDGSAKPPPALQSRGTRNRVARAPSMERVVEEQSSAPEANLPREDGEMPSTPFSVPKIEFTRMTSPSSDSTLPPIRLMPDIRLIHKPAMKVESALDDIEKDEDLSSCWRIKEEVPATKPSNIKPPSTAVT